MPPLYPPASGNRHKKNERTALCAPTPAGHHQLLRWQVVSVHALPPPRTRRRPPTCEAPLESSHLVAAALAAISCNQAREAAALQPACRLSSGGGCSRLRASDRSPSPGAGGRRPLHQSLAAGRSCSVGLSHALPQSRLEVFGWEEQILQGQFLYRLRVHSLVYRPRRIHAPARQWLAAGRSGASCAGTEPPPPCCAAGPPGSAFRTGIRTYGESTILPDER